ncbi:hypothetical protein BIW11_03037 [Tropilaelaps mercedesae]|uniref:Uncharacterized protein n=1 Tax=Tropilaelaps mercedesae TaxID=418985 RepID=A0A1V9XSY2_9ACAR|nr:hypothetical protein BIW11_03037 [Tropilaelaps mercedesae]
MDYADANSDAAP